MKHETGIVWKRRAGVVGLTALLAVSLPAAMPRDKLKAVEPDELLQRPQNFWSIGITFTDEVTTVPGIAYKIGDRTFWQAETRAVGTIYVEDSVIQEFSGVKLPREFILNGTVMHQSKGILSRKDHYYVVISSATASAVSGVEEVTEEFQNLSLADSDPATQSMIDLSSSAQRELMTFAEEQGVDLGDLFDPESELNTQAKDVVRRSLRKLLVTSETTSDEILIGFIFNLLSHRMAPQTTEAPPPSVEESPVAPAPPTEAHPAPEKLTTESAPPPRVEPLALIELAEDLDQGQPTVEIEIEEAEERTEPSLDAEKALESDEQISKQSTPYARAPIYALLEAPPSRAGSSPEAPVPEPTVESNKQAANVWPQSTKRKKTDSEKNLDLLVPMTR